MKQLRVAILGGGRMAQKHATAVRLRPGAKLVAVGDPFLSGTVLQQRFGSDVQAFSDIGRLLEQSKPDVVHIVTPPGTHRALAIQCLQAGANVYVEKPFALTGAEATEILDIAESRGLKACAAHQVLFQRAGQRYQDFLPTIGDIVHVESYFSFKPVRRRPDGGAPLSAVDQLIDILPHPVYLLLSALEHQGQFEPRLSSVDVDPDGEVRATIRCGRSLANLTVSLRARPVESYLRVVGLNGSVEADFILGDVTSLLGPGASAPAVVVKPFSQGTQKLLGSAAGLARLIFKPQKSYPGLGELLQLFYDSICSGSATPTSRKSILQCVSICEAISDRLIEADAAAEAHANAELADAQSRLPPVDATRGTALVTGGSGLLGRRTLAAFRSKGWAVRAPVRRAPSSRSRIPGVEYVTADLASQLPDTLFDGVSVVAHLAAETAGDISAHERNTVNATKNLLAGMRKAGVKRLINISSVAVLKPGPKVLTEDSAVDRNNLARGPYVWAKAEAEAAAIEEQAAGMIEVRTIRLGPLVDYGQFTAPGRLGREVARLYVAMGGRSGTLSVCDVATAARAILHYAEAFHAVPHTLNLLEVPAPTRGELAVRLRNARPDLRFLWMPFPVLKILSWTAIFLQKLLRPGKPALNLYSAFKTEVYDTTLAQQVLHNSRPVTVGPHTVAITETAS